MLTRLAHLLLVATSLAPIALVYGVTLLPGSRLEASLAIVCAILLTAVCFLLLQYLKRHGERQTLAVKRAKNVSRDILAFLIAYLLPLITRTDSRPNVLAAALVIFLLAVVIYRMDMLYVNPLLGILGFRFLEVIAESENTYLLLTRSDFVRGDREVRAIRIAMTIWLEV